MAVPDLITELTAARDILDRNIRGLQGLQRLNFSVEARAEVDAAANWNIRRHTLVNRTLECLNAIQADGYPATPKEDVPKIVLEELEAMVRSVLDAFTLFAVSQEAATAEIKFQ